MQAGETLTSTDRQINCGGKGLNQSIAASKAGAEVFHAGKIGFDGDLLTQMLGEAGVDTSFVRRSSDANGHAIIQVDPNGQNCILLHSGSKGCIYDDGKERISQASYRVKAVDTTAAGDTFTGYFVAAISEGADPASAIELATRAAAIAVSRPGAAGSIPSRDTVEAYSFDASAAEEA